MAQATAVKTYDVTTNVRDVSDLIGIVARTETPFYNALEKVSANGSTHETQQYALTTGSTNVNIEGADYSLTKNSVPTTSSNYTQIFFKGAKVSKTQAKTQMYGIEDLLAREVEWRLKEIATDIEKYLWQGTGNSGASGTAREMYGALALISTNVETGTGTGSEALSEDMFNDALQTIWTAGGRPDSVYCNGFQKRQISAFTASSTKNVDASDKRLVAPVEVYESDFGVMKINIDAFVTTSVVAIMDSKLWELAMLRPVVVEDYPAIGSYVAKTIEGELTLGSRAEKGNGKITGLSTS